MPLRPILIIALSVICCIPLFAQEPVATIRGTVSGNDGTLPGAVVVCLRKGQTEVSYTEYTLTDAQGRFLLPLKSPPAKGDSIRVSILGYITATVPIAPSGDMDIRLDANVIQLREVMVRAPKVRWANDTVHFNVQSFVEAQDKSIADVLKRMPGIEVRDNGDILYNGESIGNLYIEGTDLVGGRYSLLTTNLSATDIKTVEIMERHQPVKVLSTVSKYTRPAINLVLKDRSRGKWVGSADVDAGATSDPEALWSGNLFLMRVGKKWNSVNNLKTNNTGKDITGELDDKSIYNSPVMQRPDNIISVGTTDAPLAPHRVKFNTSALLNTSNLWKLDDGLKVSASLAYLFDRLTSANASATTYYFNNDTQQTVAESDEALSQRHRLQARIDAEANREKYYFRNLLSAEGEAARTAQTITGQFPNTQNARLPYYHITDNLKYIRRSGNNAITVESRNAFSHSDQHLTVLRADRTQRQNIGVMDFNTDTYLSSDFVITNRLTIGLTGGIEASLRSLKSRLQGIDTFGLGHHPLHNDMLTAYIRPYITPRLEFLSKSWEIRLSAPIGWSYYWGLNTNHFTYSVSGYVKYMPHPKFNIELIGSASSQNLDIRNYYTGYILQNYRYLTVGSVNTRQDSNFGITGRLNFKDPVNMLFVEGTVGRYWNVMQTSVTKDFLGDYIVLGTEYAPNRGDSWYAAINGSIGLYGINGKIGATVAYSDFSSTSMFQNGERTPYRTQTITFTPTFSGRFAKWLSMEYKLKYYHHIMSLPGTGTTDIKDNFSHILSLNITPIKPLDISLSAEHYFTMLAVGQTKNTVLLDASATYCLNNRIELRLTAHNLLNQKAYTYSVFTPLQEFSCEYRIRPLNITAGVSFEF